jgi:hypothetical protein
MDGPRGWSGNPQRLSVRGRGGTVRSPGSPQLFAAQLRSHKLTVHAISCEHAGYGVLNHCLPNEELGNAAKLFPIVCKVMRKHQPRENPEEPHEECPQKFVPVCLLSREDRPASEY